MLRPIQSTIPDAIIDLRYATANNVTGKVLYHRVNAVLRRPVLVALTMAAGNLREHGYRLVIWDAYRPLAVQSELRKVCSDEQYVAEVSNHCRGISADLTLANEAGKYLDMGTDYDNFSERAHQDTALITSEQAANRQILKQAMVYAGFTPLSSEWWHFDFTLGGPYEVIQHTSVKELSNV